MNDEFAKNDLFRHFYFNLEEILNQACPSYSYEKTKEYRNSDSQIYNDVKGKTCYLKTLKNDSDTQQKKVKFVLEVIGFDLEHYKNGVSYLLPPVIAELIYVIAKEDSSRNSTISNLKNNKAEKLSYEERFSLEIKLFEEIKKDCDIYITHLNNTENVIVNDYDVINACDTIIKHHNYLLQVYDSLNLLSEKIDKLKKGLHIPIIPYYENFGRFTTIYDRIKSGEEHPTVFSDTLKALKFDLDVFAFSAQFCEYGEFDNEIANVNKAIDELQGKINNITKRHEKLESLEQMAEI